MIEWLFEYYGYNEYYEYYEYLSKAIELERNLLGRISNKSCQFDVIRPHFGSKSSIALNAFSGEVLTTNKVRS